MKITLLSALLLVILSSCGTNETVRCFDAGNTSFRFIGFTGAQVDTVVVRRYLAGSGVLQDSFVLDLNDLRYGGVHGDTALLYDMVRDSIDYQISIPQLNRDITITEILKEPAHSETIRRPFASKVEYNCINHFLSFRQDGLFKPIDQSSQMLDIYK